MKDKTKLIVSILIVMVFILGFSNFNSIKGTFESLFLSKNQVEEAIGNNSKEEEVKKDNEVIEEVQKVNKVEIVATGDILIHQEILDTQYDANTGEYDFTNNFKYIKDTLESADLAIGNLETTLAGTEYWGYGGYPSFNTPDSLADAMKWTGYDVIANMNNHALDRDVYGYERTRNVLLDKGFEVIGTRGSIDDKRYIIKNINDINIGIISYGYTMTAEGNVKGLNGIAIPDELIPLMNHFHPLTLEEDLNNMKEQIALMREDGAEIIIFYMHWGDEYELEPNDTQRTIAQFLTDEKVDIIFGTHPHSIQPIDILKSSDGTSDTAVVYSMGNFLSSQRTERIENPYTEDGVIVSVSISKDMKTNEVTVDVPTYIPTWVNWYSKNDKLFYEVIPATINNAEYLNEEGKTRVVESLNRTKSIVEMYNENIKIK